MQLAGADASAVAPSPAAAAHTLLKGPPDVDGMVALSLVTDHDDDPFKARASLLCSIVVVSFYGTVSRLSFCV